MGVKNLEITLQCSNPNLVYFGGGVIEGIVRFTIDDEPMSARGKEGLVSVLSLIYDITTFHNSGVRLQLVGEAKVEWIETHTQHLTKGHGKDKKRVTKQVRTKHNNQGSYFLLDVPQVWAKPV